LIEEKQKRRKKERTGITMPLNESNQQKVIQYNLYNLYAEVVSYKLYVIS
jgi:hypothetical protein